MPDFQPRFLHCRIRVRDMERSLKFYSEVFGFRKVRESTSPAGNRLAFIELPGNNTHIELCHQPDSPDFSFPEDIFHFAFSVPDLHKFRLLWEPLGIEFWPESGPVNDLFYFINDPDGYEIEVMKG
ncbi:MAG: VOC family protein [Chloroflexi bacterium]|nr:VOC family protein [Chloroflexota bacterium]